MTIDLLRGLITLALLILFIGIWIWAWSAKRKPQFREAAYLPLLDDDEHTTLNRLGSDGREQE